MYIYIGWYAAISVLRCEHSYIACYMTNAAIKFRNYNRRGQSSSVILSHIDSRILYCTNVYTVTCTRPHAHGHMHAHAHSHMHTHAHLPVLCVCIYIYIYAHSNTHIHT